MDSEIEINESPVQDVKKHKFTWLGLLLSAIAGGMFLALIILIFMFYAFYDTMYFNYSYIPETYKVVIWPCLFIGGAAGALIYYAGSMLRSSSSISSREIYPFFLAIGVFIWITAGIFIAFASINVLLRV